MRRAMTDAQLEREIRYLISLCFVAKLAGAAGLGSLFTNLKPALKARAA